MVKPASGGDIAWTQLPPGVNPIFAVAVTDDGQYAACGRANQIFIYHVPTGREVGRLSDFDLITKGYYKTPGIAHLVPHPMFGQIYLTIRFFLYGDEAAVAAAEAGELWQAWINDHFAPVGDMGEAAMPPA